MTMRTQAYARAAATMLAAALVTGAALAQTAPARMTDVGPLPAEDRNSVGAIVLMEEPVIAQREAMTQMAERSGVDTRSMGAGPAPILQREPTKEELEKKRLQELFDKGKK
jgi:hypothetical protein